MQSKPEKFINELVSDEPRLLQVSSKPGFGLGDFHGFLNSTFCTVKSVQCAYKRTTVSDKKAQPVATQQPRKLFYLSFSAARRVRNICFSDAQRSVECGACLGLQVVKFSCLINRSFPLNQDTRRGARYRSPRALDRPGAGRTLAVPAKDPGQSVSHRPYRRMCVR